MANLFLSFWCLAAFPASSIFLKRTCANATYSGTGRIFRVASVTIPSVPSAPQKRWVKSYPVENLGASDPVLITSPLAGVPVKPARPLDGVDLAPTLLGRDTPAPDRLIFSHWNGKVSVRSQRFRLDDAGKTWKIGETVSADTSESQAAERSDGTLVLSARTIPPPGKTLPLEKPERTIAISKDGGETWQPATFDATLHDPGCQASLYQWPEPVGKTRPWLYSHPSGPDRRNLLLRISRDEGRTWDKGMLLREGNAQYSCLARLPDGAVGCLYESWVDGNYHLYFTRLPLPVKD